MSLEPKKSHTRHLLKSVTWRVVGTLDTILLGWLISGDIRVGATIGGFEVVTKMVLYYLHERAWYRWGSIGRTKPEQPK